MLSIGAMGKANKSTANYYLNLAREDYYTQGGEPPGRWEGEGVKSLGLVGTVEAPALRKVLAGYDPRGGQALVQNAGPDHLTGWDFTFSAPKSVSVLWSQTDPATRAAIQAAQQTAVRCTLGFIEAHAAYTRRGHGSKQQEPVAGLVVATFEHSTSREQDPQLHTHCLIANLAPRLDGTWGALDSRHLYRWKMAAGAIYRAELAYELQDRLGLGITRDQRSFRVHGVPKAVEEHFSKRAARIAEHMHRLGFAGPKAAAAATLDSRERKDVVNRPALLERWQAEGQGLGFGPAQAAAFIAVPPAAPSPAPPTPANLLAALTETASTFTEGGLWRAAAEACQGVCGYEGIQERVAAALADPECVRLGLDAQGATRYSTREMVALEEALAQSTLERAGEGYHRVGRTILAGVLADRLLTPEQIDAVRHLTRGAGGVACVVGMAGTGKSEYVLAPARAAWEQAGFRVNGAALSGKAAQGLQQAAGIPSETLHALLQRLDSGAFALRLKDILVIDEAGMVGSRIMKRLLDHAHPAGAKVVFIGDDRQLQPIDAGGAFRALKDRLGAPLLADIRRQREAWARQAVHDFADGKAAAALAAYQDRGRLIMADDRTGAIAWMADDWMTQRKQHPEQSTILLAATREETQQLNAAVRGRLRDGYQLGADVTVKTDHGMREFAAGDRILFTRNSQLQGIKNGTLGTVERVANRGVLGTVLQVRLDNGKLTSIHDREYTAFDYGYALTTHKAQGVTVDHAFVLTGSPMTDRELSYVQMSRHREYAQVYVDRGSIEELLSEARPTAAMVGYAEDIARTKALRLPTGYESDFLACRDFLNAHAERAIATRETPALQELYALARQMSVSHAKDTTLDYRQDRAPGRMLELER